MDPEEDEEFFYIAKKGLNAQVPEPWKVCQTKSSEIYYFNPQTNQSQWEHPCDEEFRAEFRKAKAFSASLRFRKKDDVSENIFDNDILSPIVSPFENKPDTTPRSAILNQKKKSTNIEMSEGDASGLNYSPHSISLQQSPITQKIKVYEVSYKLRW